MSRVLVDSNVLLDVLTDDPQWGAWSAAQLNAVAAQGELAVNPIIYAEVSVGFERIEDLDAALAPDVFLRLPLPWEAASWPARHSLATGGPKAYALHRCPTSTSAPMPPSKACNCLRETPDVIAPTTRS